jgi:hypothetical protein
VQRAWTDTLYGVRLGGEQRHRKTRDEQERRAGFRVSPYSPMETDDKDREQRPGEGEVKVLSPAVGALMIARSARHPRGL